MKIISIRHERIGPQPPPPPPQAGVRRRAPVPEEPTVTEMAENFVGAMARWAKAGFKTVPRETYESRTGVCEACEMWDGTARLGLGKCNAKKCGCTGMKRWLASEKCPLAKW